MRWIIGLLLIVLIALQYRLWFGAGSWAEVTRLQQSLVAQQQHNASLQACNDELATAIDRLKQGLYEVEKQAREQLGMIKKGETFYLLVDDNDAQERYHVDREITCLP